MKLKKADTAFSKWVRRRDSFDGVCLCPLCTDMALWQDFTCGHYIKRRHLNTRWHPGNAFAICAKCNSKMENDTELLNTYGKWILRKIGHDRWGDLMKQRLSKEKYMQHEIDEIEKEYNYYLKLMG